MTTQPSNKLKLGILLCGDSPDRVVEQHGLYDTLFIKMLGPDTFNYQTYAVIDGELPESADAADAWLITGSKHGAYDPLPWIAPLETFIQDAFALEKPMVGICFGHQIIAQAMGGEVEKYSGGWIVGTRDYQLDAQTGVESAVLNAWHQDQVVKLPENARSLGSSDNCQFAAIAYGDHAVTLQPHPEFENEYVELLLTERGKVLPAEDQDRARRSLGQKLTNATISTWLINVLGGSRKNADT